MTTLTWGARTRAFNNPAAAGLKPDKPRKRSSKDFEDAAAELAIEPIPPESFPPHEHTLDQAVFPPARDPLHDQPPPLP
jgi:hypothetical protein